MKQLKFSTSNLQEIYNQKKHDAADVVRLLGSDLSFITFGCYAGTPNVLAKAVVDLAKNNFFKNRINTMLFRTSDLVTNMFKDEDILKYFKIEVPFAAGVTGSLIELSDRLHLDSVEYVPMHFSKMSTGFLTQHHNVPDVHMFQVSPMDKAGYFSFGTDGSYSIRMAKEAKKRVVEVNKFMPRTFGQGLIHISDIDYIVENDCPLVTLASKSSCPEDYQIAEQIIPFIKDGSCLQLGIGEVPFAIGEKLLSFNDLGVHAEMLGTTTLELILNGNVTNKYKNIDRYCSVFNVSLLSEQAYYDSLHDNPTIHCCPSEYVNNPDIICQIDNMISINTFIEIDLYGQVAAESINWRQLTGTGGQVDFIRGATASKGGFSFLAALSTIKNNTISKIVPRLSNIVTTARTDVQYVATEYGCVNLQGKSTKQRALCLIELAHPKFRDSLREDAKKMNII
ncbi:MAG: hypothetical protein ORN85_04550 [Sediminibacterium sp.]|nr:hypothetical protein [Sediminibacterium sp.]